MVIRLSSFSQAGGKYIAKEKAYEIICNGLQMLRDGKSREEAKSAVVTWPQRRIESSKRTPCVFTTFSVAKLFC